MTLNNKFPNEKKAWGDLIEEAKNFNLAITKKSLKSNSKFILKNCGITLDFSRQNINPKILRKLILLAKESDLGQNILDFSYPRCGVSEKKPEAMHMILRSKKKSSKFVGKKLRDEVKFELEKFLFFAEKIRAFGILGWNNQPIKDIVVIGLGGSILGPKLATEALDSGKISTTPNLYFISNPDCFTFDCVLKKLNAKETFFIIQSKSLNTPEISILKNHAIKWIKSYGCSNSDLNKHFAVVTANLEQSKFEGYKDCYTFRIWEWVGGRFSVWSSIGLPVAIAVGAKKFREFLSGAEEMDVHFIDTEFSSNLPVLAALLSIWNRNFLNFQSYVVAPYTSKLDRLVDYIQQLDMESLGKNMHLNGEPCKIDTGQIVWGGAGIQGQHAYFQLLHQGKQVVPVDFYGLNHTHQGEKIKNTYSSFVFHSLKAQADALFLGDKINNFEGNRPSTIFLMDKISPRILGSLLSMHEHRIFVMASIWNINAFDQPGVELGKKLLSKSFGNDFE